MHTRRMTLFLELSCEIVIEESLHWLFKIEDEKFNSNSCVVEKWLAMQYAHAKDDSGFKFELWNRNLRFPCKNSLSPFSVKIRFIHNLVDSLSFYLYPEFPVQQQGKYNELSISQPLWRSFLSFNRPNFGVQWISWIYCSLSTSRSFP